MISCWEYYTVLGTDIFQGDALTVIVEPKNRAINISVFIRYQFQNYHQCNLWSFGEIPTVTAYDEITYEGLVSGDNSLRYVNVFEIKRKGKYYIGVYGK